MKSQLAPVHANHAAALRQTALRAEIKTFMKTQPRVLSLARSSVLALLLAGCAQPLSHHLPDPYQLTQPKNFTARRASSNNPDWGSNDDSQRPIHGETTVLADLRGPGVINHLWMTIADNEYGWPRLLRLRVYYDDSPVPSVDAPVGDFFAVGNGAEAEVESLMVRNSSDGRARNCYWPMPFRKSCKITITNEGRRRVSMLYYHVDWQKVPSLPARTPYFHARYRQALPAPPDGSNYEILNVTGRGHYVGTVLSVVQAEPGWFGEGDEYFWVDGSRPAIEGTGTEDYFNDAWGLHVNDGPHYGVTVAEGTGLGSRMTAYRWHLLDPIPFKKSLKFDIEHRGWTYNADGSVKSAFGERTDLISSVAFWYQEGIAADQPPMPYGSARLPQGNALQIEVERNLAQVRADAGQVSLSPELFWSKDVIIFEARGQGSRVEVPFDVPQEGDYEIYTEVAQGPDYGVFSVLLDGQSPAGAQLEHEPGADILRQDAFDGYAPETYVGLAHPVGWLHLTPGRHQLTFVCQGKREASAGFKLGVDNVVLARVGNDAWAAASQTSAPRLPQGSAQELGAALTSNPDPILRGLAAIALRDLGPAAAPAIPNLIAALKDTEVSVRMMSANALAALGPAAADAVPALVDAGSAANEQVHVLRSIAAALGNIGKPAATPALPVLRDLRKIPRVQWTADAALRKLE